MIIICGFILGGAGISELDLNKPHSVFRQHSNGEVPGLEDDFIMSAVEDSVNRGIWFGTTHGLLFYDKKQELFSRVDFDSSVSEFESVGSLCCLLSTSPSPRD